ncbi:MAG: hypothetical protein EXR63_00860 [Dehalococcoidia bacterium]|nr:hypothetical protein [Dehalococcoidia bacterium]
MTTAPDHAAENAGATARLRALVVGLDEAQLARPVGGGWTVATALAHLAFWDRRQHAALQHHRDGIALGDDDSDNVNAAVEPLLLALAPRAAVEQALEAAAAVDAVISQLSPAVAAEVLAGTHAYVVRRWTHRDEHVAQIERALST